MPPLYQQVCERIEAIARRALGDDFRVRGVERERKKRPGVCRRARPVTAAESNVFQQRVRWNYLQTMEIPLVAGRGLTPQDDERAPNVAVINQSMARRFFGDENPLGKRFGFGRAENSAQIEIVGVARDSRYLSPRRDVPSIAYLPFPQNSLRHDDFHRENGRRSQRR